MALDITRVGEQTPVVTLTEKATQKTLEFMEQAQGACLRVGVRGGGCSGFKYHLAVDHPSEKDIMWEQDGVVVICDPDSAFYLRGATLDYKETFEESGFEFDNPRATSGCGCGSSFRVDDQEGCDAVAAEDIYGADDPL